MKPTIVIVHTSDSPFFPGIAQIFPFAEFERLAFMAATANGDHLDTDVSVLFDDGSEYQVSLCLGRSCQFSFQDFASKVLNADPDADTQPMVDFLSDIEFVTH